MGSHWAALGDFGGHFWHRRLSLGHFEITWGICIHFGKFLAAISTYEGDFKSFWVAVGIHFGDHFGHGSPFSSTRGGILTSFLTLSFLISPWTAKSRKIDHSGYPPMWVLHGK